MISIVTWLDWFGLNFIGLNRHFVVLFGLNFIGLIVGLIWFEFDQMGLIAIVILLD